MGIQYICGNKRFSRACALAGRNKHKAHLMEVDPCDSTNSSRKSIVSVQRFDILRRKVNHHSESNAVAGDAMETNAAPGLFPSMLRGGLGFAVVSMAGFAVWAFAGKWLHTHVGEAGLYLACAITFVGLSGLVLHPLVRGPNSLARFYKIFIPAFCVYAIAWSAAWFMLRFGWGEWLGSLAGSVLLAAMIGRGFGTFRSVIKVSMVVFALHSAGYFGGGWIMSWSHIALAAKLGWGLVYGLGLGTGLGYAFFTFQNELPTASAR
jgi:hypothetical protein